MSNSKERKEKNCLNCSQTVLGHYCQNCGQQNTEPKESFWHLISHFFQDVTHFDGKFFVTTNLLIKKPGFLSDQFVKGRRMRYLDPIRFYLFVSASFFFLLFLFFPPNQYKIITVNSQNENRQELITKYEKEFEKNRNDSSLYKTILLLKDTSITISEALKPILNNNQLTIGDNKIKNQKQYDSS